MKPSDSTIFQNIVRIARPLALLAAAGFYALGAGLASYLGYTISVQTYAIGQAIVTFLQLSSAFLKVYYDPALPGDTESPISDFDNPPPGKLRRTVVLQVALLMLTSGAALTVLLVALGNVRLPAYVLLGIAFVLAFFYAVPPLRLVENGYGELAYAFLLANLAPALGFVFQTGELHRLLAMLTFPLLALALAYSLVTALRAYGADARRERRTLLMRMGWQQGMLLHNILVLMAYLLLGLASLMGLPWVLTWPGLLSLPVGLFQVWQVAQIAQGAPPRWRLLTLTAISSLGLTLYLLNLALWTH